MFLKLIKYTFSAFFVYLFIGFFLIPFIVKPQLIKILEQTTTAKVKIESLYCNPLIFQVTIDGFSLQNSQKEPLASFETLRINLDPSSLLIGAVALKELTLVKPKINIVLKKDKSVNLLEIIKKQKEETEEAKEGDDIMSSLPRMIIDSLAIQDGSVSYTDYTRKRPFLFEFTNIGFLFQDFDTQKLQQNKSANIRLYSHLSDGGFIDIKSKLLCLKPLKLQGNLDFEASQLYTEWKYMRDILNLEVADGKVSLSGKYTFNLDDINATKIEDLHIVLNRLRVKPKNKNKDILNLDTLYIKNATVFPMQQSIEIEKLGMNGLRVWAKRSKNYHFDWIEYLKINAEDTNTTKSIAAKKKKESSWKFLLHSLALENIAGTLRDEAIKPKVVTKINKLDIYANNITLLGEKPLKYQIDMLLNSQTECNINGALTHRKLDLKTFVECKNFDLVHYRPYIRKIALKNLKKYDLLLDRAIVDFDMHAKVFEEKQHYLTEIDGGNIKVKKFLLRKRTTHERILRFQELLIQKINLNTASKELNVSNIAMNTLGVNISRKKSGKLNVDGIVLSKLSKKIKKHVQKKDRKEKPYRIQIKNVALNNAKVIFADKKLSKTQKHILDRVYVKIENIDSKKYSWLHYRASLRLNKKGVLRAKGLLRHTPLKQQGTLRAKEISLVPLTPYLQENSYVSIDDGFLSFRIKESYAPSKSLPDVKMYGSLQLNSLFTTNIKDKNSSLFSLNELEVKPFTLELFPNRLYIDKVLVDSFYVSAKIDENKTFNFAKLTKKNQQKTVEASHKTTKTQEKKEVQFPVTIAKVDVKNGSAEFQDFSLPIKFKTNIHDLQGVVYAVSNIPGGTTYLDMDGEIDKYGSTKFQGSVDVFNPKEYVDLDLNFKNLNLPAMSGYSATFAGYEIEAGKLYLDLGYDIMYGKLHATNNIMVKHIKLGRQLEGKNIKHLPLGFVIGLLEDSDGIIDIDMPIKGDVNAPDFKYGALVWKTLGNLITKAVTSPFRFLGSAMGIKGKELEYIAFEFGKSNITPPEREKLDKILKMMDKRPKIILELSGTYDEVKDLEALRLQKLVHIIMKKSGEENIKNARTALTIDMLENVYTELRDDNKLAKLQKKLKAKYKDKEVVYKREYQKALIALCSEMQNIPLSDMEELAQKRAYAVVSYLVKEKGLQAQRVKIKNIVKVANQDNRELRMKLDIDIQSEDK